MYTYAFFPSSETPSELPEGISGSLQLITVNQLAALVEPDLTLESLQSSDDVLMQAVICHDQVIRELFEQTTVLPLRFGTCFISRQGLEEHLGSHSTEYLNKLSKLKDRAEYVLKLTPVSLSEKSVSSNLKGRNYFLAKKQHYQTQTDWQHQQQRELLQILTEIAQRYPNWIRSDPKDGIERIYVLSDRHSENQLHKRAKNWQSRSTGWELSLGEALPPYHFV